MYEKTECAVLISNNLIEWFKAMIGVRQGCLLSPTLFNIFLEFVMAELKLLRDELHLDEQLSTNCRYADDTRLIAAIFEKLKLSKHELEKACSNWGMKINVKMLREKDKRKLIVFENNCLRTIAGVALIQRVRLDTIRADLDITDTIIQLIQRKRLNWFGHVLRRDPQKSYVYLLFKSEFQNSRPRGHPPLRWKDQIKKDTGFPFSHLKDMQKTKPAGKIVWTKV